MKKQIVTIMLVTVFLCSGCVMTRQCAIDISKENIKNAETIKEVSSNCLSVWEIQSGFIKGALGNRINELPKEAIEAIDELDRLAALPELSDYELGYFLGLKVRMLNSVIETAIKKYAPELTVFLSRVF